MFSFLPCESNQLDVKVWNHIDLHLGDGITLMNYTTHLPRPLYPQLIHKPAF